MNIIFFFLVAIGLLVLLDAAALLWGVDTRDGLESREWDRRRNWNAHR
jgi:hypothetical protein